MVVDPDSCFLTFAVDTDSLYGILGPGSLYLFDILSCI